MRVFLTGGSGFIGSAIVQDLHNAGHQITGLARSEESATKLEAAGVTVLRGSLDDLDSLTRGARESEGVIHVGYNHDWLRNPTDDVMKAFMAAAETDRRAIETLAAALEGSNRPLVIATGTAGMTPGKLGTEEEDGDPAAAGAGRRASEQAALSMAARGVRSSIVRLPPTVHGAGDHGFVYRFVEIARAKNASAYIGDGSNRWPAVHRVDAAQAFRLALEKAPAGSRVHAVAEEGVPFRQIAQAIGEGLGVPVVSIAPAQAAEQFGALGNFVGLDNPTSSRLTRERLGWSPTHAALVDDIEANYVTAASSK